MNVIKYCSSCQTEKPITDFGKRSASRDGLASKCKQCQRDYDKSRANNPDRAAARAAYARTERGKEARRRAQAKYAESHRDEVAKRCREYRRNNPKKSRAHDLVAYAMKTGALTREPCEVCGQKSAWPTSLCASARFARFVSTFVSRSSTVDMFILYAICYTFETIPVYSFKDRRVPCGKEMGGAYAKKDEHVYSRRAAIFNYVHTV
jgi:hypothetical protein